MAWGWGKGKGWGKDTWGGNSWGGGKDSWGKGWGKGAPSGSGKSLPSLPAGFSIDESARYTGRVSYYNKWKGYGFVNLSQSGVVPGDRIFVHWRNLQTEDRFPFLAKDMEVEFGLMKWRENQGGWNSATTLRAKTVTKPGGATISLQDTVDLEKKSFVGGQDLRYTGKLKFYDPRGGFGYVVLDPGYSVEDGVPGELRVERAEVNAGGKQPLTMEGIEVEFGIWKTRRGAYKVYNMTLPGGVALTQDALEHRIVMTSPVYRGEVKMWNWRQGWGFIKVQDGAVIPANVIQKLTQQTQTAQQKAASRGKNTTQDQLFYFRRSDLKPGNRLSKDSKVTFQIYTDDKGAGACEIQLAH